MYTFVALMFIIGLQQGGRYTIGYCYMMEMAPEDYHGMMGTMWCITETFVYMADTLYFWYICKQWHYIIIFAAFEQGLTILLILFLIPESPKWLFNQKKYHECYKSLEYMARNNGLRMLKGRMLMTEGEENIKNP